MGVREWSTSLTGRFAPASAGVLVLLLVAGLSVLGGSSRQPTVVDVSVTPLVVVTVVDGAVQADAGDAPYCGGGGAAEAISGFVPRPVPHWHVPLPALSRTLPGVAAPVAGLTGSSWAGVVSALSPQDLGISRT